MTRALLATGLLLASTVSANMPFQEPTHISDELIVKYKPGSRVSLRSYSLARRGHRKLGTLAHPDFERIKINRGESLEDTIRQYEQDPEVEFVQRNYTYRLSATLPNDPSFGQLWGLRNTGQTILTTGIDSVSATGNPGISGRDMSLASAWDILTDCSSITVAVIDSGINYNHADLAGNMWNGGIPYPNHGYDFVDGDDDPMDHNGHGTHVAGTIGAVGNNGVGVTGVCWGVQLMALRAADQFGVLTTASLVSSINFAVANGAHVLNLSLGGTTYDTSVVTALSAARTAGVTVVAAAGNSGTNNATVPTYPCNYDLDNIICVGAANQTGAPASFTNYSNVYVDIAAPGVNVLSTWPGAQTTTVDPMTAISGWVSAGAWGHTSVNTTLGTFSGISVPNLWNGTLTYSNNANDVSYKVFDHTGADVITLSYYIAHSIAAGDAIEAAYSTTGTDPFAGGTTTILAPTSGSTGGALTAKTVDISACTGANCAIGFRFTSDGAGVSTGAVILMLTRKVLDFNNTTYNVLSGTSMATPHVAGLAAMLLAHHPLYEPKDVRSNIVNAGVSIGALSGYTVNGSLANAYRSLLHINKPTDLTVAIH